MMLDVSDAALSELLQQGAESPTLEFVADCDLAERRDIVELCTEVGALASRGGAIVVGVDDNGHIAGLLTEERVPSFDEANLRNVLGHYLPPSVALRVGQHVRDGRPVVLLQVGAHEDGAAVFLADGNFEWKGKARTAFRAGEFFVRHGTRSELPTQEDLRAITQAAVLRARLWMEQIHRVQTAIDAVSETAVNESAASPDGRITGFGRVTRLPTVRKQLAGALNLLEQLGGPKLPQCWELAQGQIFVTHGHIVGAAFTAMDELSRSLEDRSGWDGSYSSS